MATIAQIRGAAPIVTAGTAVTNSTVTLSYDLANHDNQQGAYYNEYTPFSADQGIRTDIIGLRNNTTLMYSQANGRIYSSDGVSLIISPTGLNGATANKTATAYDATDALKYVVVNGNNSDDNPYSGTFPTDLGYIGVINNTKGANLIRNIQRWDLDYQSSKDKIDELMGS